MLPVAIDLTDRLVVCVGAGPVTARRVASFLAEGARVRVIAPERCAAVAELEHDWVPRKVRATDLDGAWFVHTATGDLDIDHEVAGWARERNAFCITAGRSGDGSAAMAARRTIPTPDGHLQVAITSADPKRSVRLVKAVASWLRGQDLRPARDPRRLVPVGPAAGPRSTSVDQNRTEVA